MSATIEISWPQWRQKFISLLASFAQVSPSEIREDMPLWDDNRTARPFNNYNVLQAVNVVEHNQGINLPNDKIHELATLGDLLDLIGAKLTDRFEARTNHDRTFPDIIVDGNEIEIKNPGMHPGARRA